MNKHTPTPDKRIPDPTLEIGEALCLPLGRRPLPSPVLSPIAGFFFDFDSEDEPSSLPSGPIFGSEGPSFDVNVFETNLSQALAGNCVGFAYAINMGGELARTGKGGSRQLRQNPADNVPMGTKSRMHIASVSKNLTATCVMKALDDMGLTVEANVADFLPSAWSVPAQLDFLKIKHLLTHRSGFNQSASDPHYSSLRDAVENLTNWSITNDASAPDYDNVASVYDNRNFGLFRLILPFMVCPQIMAGVEAQGWGDGDYHGAVDAATQDNYKFLMQHYVFSPLGMANMRCRHNQNNPDRVMFYMWPNPVWSQAQDGGDKSDEAGGEGWVMSVRQLAKYMRFRRYSTAFLPQTLRGQMDDERFGWRTIGGDHGTYLRHGGAYGGCVNGNPVPGSGPLRASIMEFPINVEAAVLVNSFVTNCGTSLDAIVRDAFDDAYV